MAIVKEVRIRVKGDDDLNSTIDNLVKMGIVTDENAAKFKRVGEAIAQSTAKSNGIITNLTTRIQNLTKARDASFDPKKIERFNKLLSDANLRMRDLTKSADQAGDQMGFLTRQVTTLGVGIAAAFSVHQIIAWGSEWVEAYKKAQKAVADLHFATTSILGATEEEFTSLNEQADALAQGIQHLFDDEMIRDAMSQLARAKIGIRDIQRIMPLIIDVAAKSGKSVAEVADLFVKGMQGNTRALIEFNAKFKDTGDEIKNINVIMESLAGFTGGAADALETFSGQAQAVENRANELAETLGQKLNPIWKAVKTGALEAATAIVQALTLDTGPTVEDRIKTEAKERMRTIAEGSKEVIKEELTRLRAVITGFDPLRPTQAAPSFFAQRQAKIELEALSELLEERKKVNERARAEEAEGTSLSLDNISTMTTKFLENAVEELKNGNKDLFKETKNANLKGLADAQARIEKELDMRAKANEKLLAMQKQFEADLEAIRIQIQDATAAAEIAQIADETAKKIASQEQAFKKEGDSFDKLQKKLEEIQAKGTAKQKDEAVKQLEALGIARQEAIKANTQKEQDIYDAADKARLEAEKKIAEEILKLRSKEIDTEARALEISIRQKYQKQLETEEISQEELDAKLLNAELGRLKKQRDLQAQAGQDTVDIEQDIAEKELEIQSNLHKSKETREKKHVEVMKSLISGVFDRLQQVSDFNLKAMDAQEKMILSSIETQRTLAEAGRKNILGQEERNLADLERRRIAEQRKIMRMKELEVFLNSVAEFSKTDPKTAVAKAVAQLAIVKSVEALYMEEGGLVGGNSPRSRFAGGRFSRRHPGGGDRLVHAQDGEGMLSRKNIANLGGEGAFMQFKQLLEMPLSERLIPMQRVITPMGMNTRGIERRLDSLEKTIRNKPETTVNFDEMGNMIVTRMENGIKETIKHLINKPRI